ncbi:MAG: murein biosynthesis integral membrane protein MurJ [Patescibacteria group bacterium]|nr:murein biosynthesis integral membrane protein MurJ [Patescibacteria group bacterium]
MNELIKRTSNLILARQTSIFSSALIISSMIFLTSVFGFLRYRVLASYFSKDQLDVFFASFKIPDLIFEILVNGTLTTSLISIYLQQRSNQEELRTNISSLINLLLLILGLLIFLVLIFLEPIIKLITPGFLPEKAHQVTQFARVLLVGQLPFLILGSFLSAISQANKIFFLSALAPVLFNLSIIVLTLVFGNRYGLLAPIIGVVSGSFLLFLVQVPVVRKVNLQYQLAVKKTKTLINFFKMALPRLLTVIIGQVDATFDLILASFLKAGSYTVFYLAQHLQFLPVSVVGVALGQASLPYLAETYQEKKLKALKVIITQSILNIFFIIVPITTFFIFARTPLVRLFFGGQKFDWQATNETALTLSLFSLGMSFHAVYYLLTRVFYAIADAFTPFKVTFLSTLVNILLNFIFVFGYRLPVEFLGLSFSISITLSSIILFVILHRKLEGFEIRSLIIALGKIISCALVASFVAYFLMRFLDGLIFNTTFSINVFFLLLTTAMIFFFLYLLLCWLVEVREIYLIGRIIVKMREYRKKVVEFYNQYE